MFTEQTIEAVWQKAAIVGGNDPNVFRKDVCGAWIRRTAHGNRNVIYGWEIDHIDPNGGDDLSNLQPLQWENNCAKGDGRLVCVVRAFGTKNIRS